MSLESQKKTYRRLVKQGLINRQQLDEAAVAAEVRDVELESVLMDEYGVPRRVLIAALAQEYGFPAIEFDEWLPVPPELLAGLEKERLEREPMFPVMLENGKVIAALNDAGSEIVREEIDRFVHGPYSLRTSLVMEILWYTQDFLNDRPGRIIGTERTGLAFWRNTMATWRTRLATYRNHFATMRSWHGVIRTGLGIVTVGAALVTSDPGSAWLEAAYALLLVVGLAMSGVGLVQYLQRRNSMRRAPGPQTLVEVTAATVSFLEDCQLPEGPRPRAAATMLSRLVDYLPSYSTILKPVPASRERTHLARERNVLAAQRTIAGCYRTLYARARTGLGFIRTGIVFLTIGAGLLQYYGLRPAGMWGAALAAAGLLMSADGLFWYLPVRREEPDLTRAVEEPAPGAQRRQAAGAARNMAADASAGGATGAAGAAGTAPASPITEAYEN